MEEVPAGLPTEYVSEFTSFYADRIKSTQPVVIDSIRVELGRFVERVESMYGVEAVKPIRDACGEAGDSPLKQVRMVKR